MALSFDYKKIMKDYERFLMSELDIAFRAWEIEVKSGLRSNFSNSMTGGKLHKIPRAWVNSYIQYTTKSIKGFLEANTVVIADSFGTGSLMLEDNPALEEYRKSKFWHKDRKRNYITGRGIDSEPGNHPGHYTDFFGRHRTTKGTFKGKVLEGMRMKNGFVIKPIPPSHALQNAERSLFRTYIPRALNNALRKINFGNYLKEK
jgi:hypothetical protein